MNNLENLFRWSHKLVINNKAGEPAESKAGKGYVVYQRIIGDNELSIARKMALKASRELRRNLRDVDSPEHAALVPTYEDLNDKELKNAILLASAQKLRQEAIRTAGLPKRPKEIGVDATLEQQEEYEVAVETFETEILELRSKKMTEIADRELKALEGRERDELVMNFVDSMIEGLCSREMLETFNAWCTFYGTYSTKTFKTREFSSFANFSSCVPLVKDQLLSGYIRLDMSGDELKN